MDRRGGPPPSPAAVGRGDPTLGQVHCISGQDIVGVADRNLAALLGGYTASGGPFYMGIGVLVAAILLYFYRRAVQDKKPITFRDVDAPTMPNAEQMALLEEEEVPV